MSKISEILDGGGNEYEKFEFSLYFIRTRYTTRYIGNLYHRSFYIFAYCSILKYSFTFENYYQDLDNIHEGGEGCCVTIMVLLY